jgi:tRNA(Ile)-lysidine synthase
VSGSVRDALLLAAGRHPLAHEVEAGLARARVEPGTRVLVAASGGADSTALLALAAGLAARGRVLVAAGHVDHGLRPESVHDRTAAGDSAGRLGVGFAFRTLSLEKGSGMPGRARDARYRALAEMAREAGCAAVLTAHHADDQAETMLLAFARGAGLAGLGGMPARRALDGGVALVRPCLRIARASLRTACEDLGLSWREDPGNARDDSPRGRMRHVVIPALEAVSPGAAERAARTAELLRIGDALLASHVEAMRAPDGSVPRAALRGSPVALAATAVWMLAGDALDDASRWKAAEAAVDGSTEPRRFPMAGGGVLRVDAHAVRVEAQGAGTGAGVSPPDSDAARQRS